MKMVEASPRSVAGVHSRITRPPAGNTTDSPTPTPSRVSNNSARLDAIPPAAVIAAQIAMHHPTTTRGP